MSTHEQRELPAPTIEHRERMTRVLWPVGAPDAEGFQLYAALTVLHYGRCEIAGWPEYQYCAHLQRAQIKRGRGSVTEKIGVLSGAGLPVDSLPAARFSKQRMATFTEACRALVERRYAEGDPTIVELMRRTDRQGHRA